MAIITNLPAQHIISGFKGKLDFYVYMGIACVRRWPRSPGHVRSPAVMSQWEAWTWASKTWNSIDQSIRDAYIDTAQGMAMTGRDLYMKAFISSYFREGQWD